MNLLWPIGKCAVHWRIYRLIAQDDRTMGLDEPLFCSFYKLTAIEDDVRKLGTETPVQIFFVNVGGLLYILWRLCTMRIYKKVFIKL